jgi:hypothetical protein
MSSKKPPKDKAPSGTDERRAARNVEKLKQKLSAALDDPLKREQIVRAMRTMMEDEK